MAKRQEKADEYHEQFADSIIKALREGTTPWQKPWTWRQPRNFSSGHDYHGGNAVYLAMVALSRGYVDPRWGSVLQIRSAGGNVRRGEKGSPIWYWQQRWLKLARDDRGNAILDEDGKPKAEWIERPFATLHTVFNVDPKEIYNAGGDAQRISDWLMARKPGKADAPVGTIHRWKDGFRQRSACALPSGCW